MDLIIGGAYQGKLTLAAQEYGLTPGDICDLAAGEPAPGTRCYIHLEELTRRQEDTESYLPLLTAAEVVIAREIGSGVVPMDAGERAWRERHGRLLRQLAGEEGSHARRLMGVYYLVTGCCYQPRLQGGRVERLPWREVLRTRYHAETCGGLRYAQAAEATEDVCLREIWEELSAAEYRHARQLLSLLEQMVLA